MKGTELLEIEVYKEGVCGGKKRIELKSEIILQSGDCFFFLFVHKI